MTLVNGYKVYLFNEDVVLAFKPCQTKAEAEAWFQEFVNDAKEYFADDINAEYCVVMQDADYLEVIKEWSGDQE